MPSLVTICGESYSGTTMLELMLGHSPRAFSCGEVAYWYRPVTEAHRRLNCGCGADPCTAWEPLRNIPAERFHAEVCRRLDVELVTDSSKRLSWVVDANRWAVASRLDVVNLAIWKSPLAHLHSHWKRGKPLSNALRRYRRYYTRLLRWGAPVMTVNYHRLTAAPASELALVCRRIGIDYFPGKECFWNGQSHLLYGNRRTQSQVGADAGAIEESVDYPPEFLAAAADVRHHWESSAMRRLCSELESRDVSRQEVPEDRPASDRRAVPWWYYPQRFDDAWRALLGRYRPAKRAG
ncbi:MAG: hypothetical protein SH850_21400 [Planctomycetaceae bacterium]|nr:hypothetical protein [Planctomycetaceae bacterium]